MQQGQNPRRLEFLDGLRGLAALYVLLFHEATVEVAGHGELSPPMRMLQAVFYRGHFSVVIFIVLSGFSLMLPVARSGSGQLRGGLRDFFRRRGRRILPPYYAALIPSIILVAAQNSLGQRLGLGKAVESAALEPGSVISHFLLVHNVTPHWVYRINGPMWSVATEWQIYFIFALVLLPLYRRFGMVSTVAFAWGVGVLPLLLLPPAANLVQACPWFLGSFALGMAGAVLSVGPVSAATGRRRMPWGLASGVLFASLIVIINTGLVDSWSLPLVDFVVSLFALTWINSLVQAETGGPARGGLYRLLSSRPLVYLGGFSYSLYLVQFPIVRIVERVLSRSTMSHDAIVLCSLLFGTPLVLGLAWVFSEFFERPFTTGGILWPRLRARFRPTPATLPIHRAEVPVQPSAPSAQPPAR